MSLLPRIGRNSDIRARTEERLDLPAGVSWSLSPLFDIDKSPWKLIRHLLRHFTVTHTVIRWLDLESSAPEKRDCLIVDLGCGLGEQGALFADARLGKNQRVQYLGLEIDPVKVSIAHELRPASRDEIFHVAGGVLDFPSILPGAADAFIISEVIQHLEEADGLKVMRLMAEHLKPGGIIVLTCPTPAYGKIRKDPWHLREYYMEELFGLAAAVNLVVLDSFYLVSKSRSWLEAPITAERFPRRLIHFVMSSTTQSMSGEAGLVNLLVLQKPI